MHLDKRTKELDHSCPCSNVPSYHNSRIPGFIAIIVLVALEEETPAIIVGNSLAMAAHSDHEISKPGNNSSGRTIAHIIQSIIIIVVLHISGGDRCWILGPFEAPTTTFGTVTRSSARLALAKDTKKRVPDTNSATIALVVQSYSMIIMMVMTPPTLLHLVKLYLQATYGFPKSFGVLTTVSVFLVVVVVVTVVVTVVVPVVQTPPF